MWGEPQQTGNRTLHGSGLTRGRDQTRSWREPHPEGSPAVGGGAEPLWGGGEQGGCVPHSEESGSGPCPVRSLYTEPVEGPYKQPWRMPKTHSLRQPLPSTEHQRKIPEALRWLNFTSKSWACRGVRPPTEKRRSKPHRGGPQATCRVPVAASWLSCLIMADRRSQEGPAFAFVWAVHRERKQTHYRAMSFPETRRSRGGHRMSLTAM